MACPRGTKGPAKGEDETFICEGCGEEYHSLSYCIDAVFGLLPEERDTEFFERVLQCMEERGMDPKKIQELLQPGWRYERAVYVALLSAVVDVFQEFVDVRQPEIRKLILEAESWMRELQ